jgi:hypothetical protein
MGREAWVVTMNIDLATVENVGFSGSKEGMSKAQMDCVYQWLLELAMVPGPKRFHHGDCVGADTEAHVIAKSLGYLITLHPPIDPKYRAHLDSQCDLVMPQYSYHGRNHRIVIASQVLIATPKSMIEKGGTWNSIRHAINMSKPRVIIDRQGEEHLVNMEHLA